jgi:hypothetical protein
MASVPARPSSSPRKRARAPADPRRRRSEAGPTRQRHRGIPSSTAPICEGRSRNLRLREAASADLRVVVRQRRSKGVARWCGDLEQGGSAETSRKRPALAWQQRRSLARQPRRKVQLGPAAAEIPPPRRDTRGARPQARRDRRELWAAAKGRFWRR